MIPPPPRPGSRPSSTDLLFALIHKPTHAGLYVHLDRVRLDQFAVDRIEAAVAVVQRFDEKILDLEVLHEGQVADLPAFQVEEGLDLVVDPSIRTSHDEQVFIIQKVDKHVSVDAQTTTTTKKSVRCVPM